MTVSGAGGGGDGRTDAEPRSRGPQHGSQLGVTRAPGLSEQEATQPAHNAISWLPSEPSLLDRNPGLQLGHLTYCTAHVLDME